MNIYSSNAAMIASILLLLYNIQLLLFHICFLSIILLILPRPTFGDTGSTMSACFLIFFPVYAVVKQTSVLVFHTIQSICKEISVKCLSEGHNSVMPSRGIEPAQPYDH